MLSEAKPALKPDLREAKGNPNREGGVAGRAIPTAEAVLPEGQSQPRGGVAEGQSQPRGGVAEGQSQPRKCYGYAYLNKNGNFDNKLFRISINIKQFLDYLRILYYFLGFQFLQ